MILVLQHIPRCAGQSLAKAFDKSGFPNIKCKTHLGALDLGNYSPTEKPNVSVYGGHFWLGGYPRNLVPGQVQYLTILRHPVDRIISWFYFLKKSPDHKNNRHVQGLGFEEWVRSDLSIAMDNLQLRSLCFDLCPFKSYSMDWLGTPRIKNRVGPTSEHFEFALAALRSCFWFGVLEEIDTSLPLLSKKLGKEIVLPVVNAVEHPKQEDLSKELLEYLLRREHYDVLLWQRAKEMIGGPSTC